MNPGDFDLIERAFASSPPLLIMSMVVVVVLWRKLEMREKKADETNERTLLALRDVGTAIQALTDEIRSRR